MYTSHKARNVVRRDASFFVLYVTDVSRAIYPDAPFGSSEELAFAIR